MKLSRRNSDPTIFEDESGNAVLKFVGTHLRDAADIEKHLAMAYDSTLVSDALEKINDASNDLEKATRALKKIKRK